MEDDETLFLRLVFSKEVTFHLSGKVKSHNVRIWEMHHPHEAVEHQEDFHEVNVFCAVPQSSMISFSLKKIPLQDQPILKCSKNWLFTLLQADLVTSFFNKMKHRPTGILRFKLI